MKNEPILWIIIIVILIFILGGCPQTQETEEEEVEQIPEDECGQVKDRGLCKLGKCTCPVENTEPVWVENWYSDYCICE